MEPLGEGGGRPDGAVDGTLLVGAGTGRATSVTPESGCNERVGESGLELGGTDAGISPAFLKRCIADSNASRLVAGGGGMARQLAMRLRKRRASTSRARFFAELSPLVSMAIV
jgi:hypothetical protein